MSLVIRYDEGNYKSEAYDFRIADDLYLFFKFRSPKSQCEIAIAYDVYVDSGDWYVNDGNLDECDFVFVDDVISNKLPRTPEFTDFDIAVYVAVRNFNERV